MSVTDSPASSPCGQPARASQTPLSPRLAQMPTYVFALLDDLKDQARARGADLIDLGMGNPDQPTPAPIIEVMREALLNPENHRYPHFKGKPAFRQAAVDWMARRYDARGLNPDTDIQPLIGSKEGLAHLSFAYADADACNIVHAPYYPVHTRATWLAGGHVYHQAMTAENQYMPDPNSIPADVAARARLYFVSYPNNPTAATATRAYYERLVDYCRAHRLTLVSDLAYSEIAYDGYRPPSVLSIPGAKDVAVEFHSFSKSFNMAGWRIGFAAGNPDVIKALYNVKTNLDYGVASAIQDGAIEAMTHGEAYLPAIVSTYQRRRDMMVEGFRALGWTIEPPKATMYLWFPIPDAFSDSMAWVRHLIETADVVVTPGVAFGEAGDRFFRVSLVSPEETLQRALARLREKGVSYG
ncbi:MAG: aminotransferase class I/II-fold pyridoxal phosphate-dependent enzyme [Vampirovibrionales bacterium]|nr:aminotransferase class I/II-fold pyridoxal phosphate-dependent enzyme [Vampirovibrionales bacterium]